MSPGNMLPDGKVLTTWNESEAELYDPGTARFRLTQGWVNDYYGVYTATLLTTGKVLITTETNTELYDPKAETFAVTGAPPLHSTATLLGDGTVLLTGACQGLRNPFSAGAQLCDPNSGMFIDTRGRTTPRASHTATLLRDGTALLAGGVDSASFDSVPMATAEIYTPVVTRPAPAILWAARRASGNSARYDAAAGFTGEPGRRWGGPGDLCYWTDRGRQDSASRLRRRPGG